MADALPRALRGKVCRRTIRNRLKEKGYVPEEKITKDDPGQKQRKRRFEFCKGHEWRTPSDWQEKVQGVGDMKDYTYYPKELKARFARIRVSWTYMTKAEKQKPAFLKPKRGFKRKEYAKVLKGKVFGLSASNGQQLLAHVPRPFTSKAFAALVRRRVGPFLRRAFPGRQRFCILLDGEPLLHAPEAAAACAEFGITVLPNWPAYSPDLNPQENVWPWIEKHLRKQEAAGDSFAVFKQRVSRAAAAYPDAERLVASLAARMRECIERKGAMTGR